MTYTVRYAMVDLGYAPYADATFTGGWWRDNHSEYCRKLRRKLRAVHKR